MTTTSTSSTPPSAGSSARRNLWPMLLGVLVALGLLVGAGAWWTTGATQTTTAGLYYTAVEMPLEAVIKKDAELQAVDNIDIVCPVEGENIIQWIIKEGATVEKGETIVVFDSTELENELQTALLDLQSAQAEYVSAREQMEIQKSTNAANLESAQAELIIARLDLEQYLKGTYPQMEGEARRAVEMAEINVATKEQELSQKQALFAKGFVNAAEVKNAEIELLTAQNDLEKKKTDQRVLVEYTHQKDLTEKRNTLQQAEKKVDRVARENASNLAEKESDLQREERQMVLRQERYDKTLAQIEACTVKAPSAGMVVYAQSGGGWGRREQPIQAGAQVRYQELLCRLPDTARMKAIARVPEEQVIKLRVDENNPMRATVQVVGVPEPLPGWVSNISVMADSSNRWWNPDSREYPVDVTLDRTPPGLKPGIKAEVVVRVDRRRSALAVPLAAVYAVDQDNYVFVRNAGGGSPTPTKVQVGLVTDTHAEIVSGLTAGTDVLLLEAGQGRLLLERAGIKVESRPNRAGDDEEDETPEELRMPAEQPNGDGPSDRGDGPPTTAPAIDDRPVIDSRRDDADADGGDNNEAAHDAEATTPAPAAPAAVSTVAE